MTRKINKLSLSWFLSKNNIAIYSDGGHFLGISNDGLVIYHIFDSESFNLSEVNIDGVDIV